MKNFFLGLTLAFLTSCGMQIENGNNRGEGSIGEIRSFTAETFDSNSLTILSNICNALVIKENLYEGYVDEPSEFSFINSQKQCDEEEATEGLVTLKLKNINGTVKYVSETQAPRFFSDYETRNQGIISKFCNKMSESNVVASSERLTGAAYADWFSVYNTKSACGEDESACFIIERGFENNTGRFEIRQYEKIVVSTKQASLKMGVVIKRESLSSLTCTDSKQTNYLGSVRRF